MRLPKDPPEMRLPSEPSLIFMALADSRSPSIAIQGAEGFAGVARHQSAGMDEHTQQVWVWSVGRNHASRELSVATSAGSAPLRSAPS
jgi:hypothetical protein